MMMCYLVPQYIGVWGGPEEGWRVEARPLAPGRRPPLLCQAHPRTEVCNSHIYCYLGTSYFILFIHILITSYFLGEVQTRENYHYYYITIQV